MTPVDWVMVGVALVCVSSLWLGDRERRSRGGPSVERIAELATYIARLRLQAYARARNERFRRYDAAWSRRGRTGTTTRPSSREIVVPIAMLPRGPWLN